MRLVIHPALVGRKLVVFCGWEEAPGVAVGVRAFDTSGSVFLGSQLPSEGWLPSLAGKETRGQYVELMLYTTWSTTSTREGGGGTTNEEL